MKGILIVLFVVSLIMFPWWVSVTLGILISSFPLGAGVASIGGLVLDLIFGSPVASLNGFQYVYTTVFLLGGVAALFIRTRMLD